MSVPDAQGGQEGTQDPLGLVLQETVSHHVDPRNQTPTVSKNSKKCSQMLSYLWPLDYV